MRCAVHRHPHHIAVAVSTNRYVCSLTNIKRPKRAMHANARWRRPDRSDVGCLHTQSCPLFPLLNASLAGWRSHYCDSVDGWRECARYRLSRTGQLVPITLLPNGADAIHLKGIPAADGSDPETLSQASPSQFEPAPPPAPKSTSAPSPAWGLNRPPPPAYAPHRPGTPSTPPAPPRRRWWTRLADWISGPA